MAVDPDRFVRRDLDDAETRTDRPDVHQRLDLEPVAVDGESIPLAGFAQLTLVGALMGVAIARLCGRTRAPRRTFAAVTVALTALSVVPDVTVDATLATRVVLVLTHLVAAAIVVPALAARLRR